MITPGMKVKVKGIVHYGQDMNFFEGDFPPNVIFTIKGIFNDVIKLTASGYGNKDDYGNGAIYLYKKYEDKLEVV